MNLSLYFFVDFLQSSSRNFSQSFSKFLQDIHQFFFVKHFEVIADISNGVLLMICFQVFLVVSWDFSNTLSVVSHRYFSRSSATVFSIRSSWATLGDSSGIQEFSQNNSHSSFLDFCWKSSRDNYWEMPRGGAPGRIYWEAPSQTPAEIPRKFLKEILGETTRKTSLKTPRPILRNSLRNFCCCSKSFHKVFKRVFHEI